jgi:arylsulfatase A-like enzyme
MVKRLSISTACLVVVAVVCCGAERTRLEPTQKPNFLVILTDDQRADAMACAGNPHIRTPNIDALAASGVRFSNAFVTTSICSPSRAALLTGRYGSANGVMGLTDPIMKPGERTWAQALKGAGYRTALIGKWHLNNPPDSLGFDDVTYFAANGP